MNEIQSTILNQLGGNIFLRLVDGQALADTKNDFALIVIFKGNEKLNYIRVLLTEFDVYDMEFGKCFFTENDTKKDFSISLTIRGIYFDKLQKEFEITTGLFSTQHPRIK